MTQEIPVFVFMGFLESGKTTFAMETLIDRDFTNGERTLVITFEEGMTEYDEEELSKRNIHLVSLEEADLNTEKLIELQHYYKPKQVMIEYNGMWLLNKLFDIRVPKGWTVVQVISLINAETFSIYFNNMKQIMMDQITNADMVVFNRCNEFTPKDDIRKIVKSVNRRGQIIYENKDGQVEVDEGELILPYDIEDKVITLKDEDFGIFYIDSADNPDKYIDKTIVFKGMVYKAPQYEGKAFVPGRFAMTCCAEDVTFVGFKCYYDLTSELKDKSWVMVEATVKKEFYKEFDGEGPVFYAKSIKPADKPDEELVYFS